MRQNLIVPRLRPHWPLGLRALWRVGVFVLLTVLVQRILVSPVQPHFEATNAGARLWEQFIEAGWWLIGARGIVGLMRLLVVLEGKPQETQIVSDLLAGGLYVATVLAIVNFAFAVPIGGLLATSGVIAIVLGLALQNTLSDVFSGIAVGLERPYKPGDLLWIEGAIEGHVTQITWRSTHIATGHNNIAIVPNSVMAKARLVNRSLPTTVRGDSMEVRIDATASPERTMDALLAATVACRIALPSPGIACTGLHGDGTVYEITFKVPNSAQLAAARSEMFAQIHRHLLHAGIGLGVASVTTVPRVSPPTISEMLERSDLFCAIDPAQRDLLAARFTMIRLGTGEQLLKIGNMPEALFVIASGTAEITTDGPHGPHVVYRMSPGEALGAIGLITGKAFVVTATALTPLRAYRLDKATLAEAIKVSPGLAAALEALAERGQAMLRNGGTLHEDAQTDHPEMFLMRLRTFVRLLWN